MGVAATNRIPFHAARTTETSTMTRQRRDFVGTKARFVLSAGHRFFRYVAIASAGVLVFAVAASTVQAGPIVRFTLNYSVAGSNGPINYFDVELYDAAAPITVANFLKYVNNGLYDGTVIHRNTNKDDGTGFVLQGGGFAPEYDADGAVTAMNPIETYAPIVNEFSSDRSNVRGTIAMAKLGGDPDSATSGWFINLSDNASNLDAQNGGFTVFGEVVGQGMTLVDGVNALTTSDLSSVYGSAFGETPLFDSGASLVNVTRAVVVPPCKLSGYLYVDINQNGVMDGDDYAISGARVFLFQAGSNVPLAAVSSSLDGSYEFAGLAAGTFSVRLETSINSHLQDNGTAQTVFDMDGNVVSVGTAGDALTHAFGDITLDNGESGIYFNIAEPAYPIALISPRLLLNSAPDLLHTENVQTYVVAGSAVETQGAAMQTPEPGSLVLLAIAGLLIVGWMRRRRY